MNPPIENVRQPELVLLDGNSLTLQQLLEIASGKKKVRIAPAAMKPVEQGFAVVMAALMQDHEIYGLTVRYGVNTDQSVFEEDPRSRLGRFLLFRRGTLPEEREAASRQFNRESLLEHVGGHGEAMPEQVVIAGMAARLNMLLSGHGGVQPAVVDLLAEMINRRIVPKVPGFGSLGQGDIRLASHIGLAMIGEGTVFFGKDRAEMDSAAVFRTEGIRPLNPIGKDYLSILSTNALTLGDAILAIRDAEEFVRREIPAFALCLEGLNGNIAPFVEPVTKARPIPNMMRGASLVCKALKGSSLYDESSKRQIQDPYSYRGMAFLIGNCLEAIDRAKETLSILINGSDDNPVVLFSQEDIQSVRDDHLDHLLITDAEGRVVGAMPVTGNSVATPIVWAIRPVLTALGEVSGAIAQSTDRLLQPDVTGLPRGLAAGSFRGFFPQEVDIGDLANRNQEHAIWMPSFSFNTAGNIGDLAVGSSRSAVEHLLAMTGNLYELLSYQMLYAAQAVDLRIHGQGVRERMYGSSFLGNLTRELYRAYRRVVPIVDRPRQIDLDVKNGIEFLRAWTGAPELGIGPTPRASRLRR